MSDLKLIERNLQAVDPEVFQAIEQEHHREESTLELIASENFVSKAVLEAQGSVMTNKYAEGYPYKRYYGGCDYVDIVEDLARERAKKLFSCAYANVQPHSGSQANMAVYLSVLKPGDTILGMDLSHGGHLTHGCKVNFSGKVFNAVSYGVDKDTQRIDYEQMRSLALEHKPKMIVCGASAYPRVIDFQKIRAIADEIDAYVLADIAHIAGLVATGLHPSPVGVADFVTTTTHKTLRGPRGGMILTNDEQLAKGVDKLIFPGIQGGPLMHVIAAKAVAFGEALSEDFKIYQSQVVANAKALGDQLLADGFHLVSGGTENHLVLVDLRSKGLTGKAAEEALGKAGITVNKNTVPFETESPFVTSGIRIGVPAVTTRGMKEEQMTQIAQMIARVIEHNDNPQELASVLESVQELCRQYPLYDA